jgi:NADH dehydrogenase FAD-containing subunit
MLSGIYRPEQIRFHVEKMVTDREGRFIQDEIIRIDPVDKRLALKTGATLSYDVVSFNTGSCVDTRNITLNSNRIFPVKPIESLIEARKRIWEQIGIGTPRIAVIGGGAAGVEMAANIHRLVLDSGRMAEIVLIAGNRMLSHFPAKARRIAASGLSAKRIRILESVSVTRVDDSTVFLSDGGDLQADIIFLSSGIRPTALFQDSGLPVGPDGGLLVNEYLQSVKYPEIFGGGDCITFSPRPLQKVGVYAVRQNPVLNHNLMAVLGGKPLKRFVPQSSYLLVLNFGDKTGLAVWKGVAINGKIAFRLKNAIDQRFIRSFQVSGEWIS